MRPTSGEPVKDMRQRFGFCERAAPVTSPTPGMTLITPSGMPISLAKCATYRVESGVSSAGLTTQVLPAAMAGPMPQPQSRNGKFHGTMKPHGPQACRTTEASWPATGMAVSRESPCARLQK